MYMIPGYYTLQGCKKLNVKRLSVAEFKNLEKNKLLSKILRGKRFINRIVMKRKRVNCMNKVDFDDYYVKGICIL